MFVNCVRRPWVVSRVEYKCHVWLIRKRHVQLQWVMSFVDYERLWSMSDKIESCHVCTINVTSDSYGRGMSDINESCPMWIMNVCESCRRWIIMSRLTQKKKGTSNINESCHVWTIMSHENESRSIYESFFTYNYANTNLHMWYIYISVYMYIHTHVNCMHVTKEWVIFHIQQSWNK